MKRILILSAILFGGLSALAETEVKFSNQELDFFEKNIRPVLSGQCMDCHGNGKAKGGLSLENREAILQGGASGKIVDLSKAPQKSLLVQVLRHEVEDMEMPPKGDQLSEAVIRNFEKWIQLGLPDPRKATAITSMTKIDVNDSRDHWAFQPVKKATPPSISSSWVQSPVDSFVLAKLKENGMTPNAKADKRTLIRRITYALTGLPPSSEEVAMFVEDDSPRAVEELVDRLLRSPHYGERWARHWLDVARYADTSGDRKNRGDPRYPFAFTFRDYVIQSLNEDKPYDEFVKEQLAADQLVHEGDDDRTKLAALGFLTVGKRFMGNDNEVIDDQIDVVTQGLMGLTASCARCHDHKFDPIPQVDYYSLHGVFASSEEPKDRPYLLEPKRTAEFIEFEAELKKLERELDGIRPKLVEKAIEDLRERITDYMLTVYKAEQTNNRAKQRAMFTKVKLNYNAALYVQRQIAKVKSNDPIFGAWVRFAKLKPEGFSAGARKIQASLADDTNRLLHGQLKRASLKSMNDVSAIYSAVFSKALKAGKDSTKELKQIRVALVNGSKSSMMPAERDARRFVNNNEIRRAQYRLQPKIFALKMEHPGSPDRAMAIVDEKKPQDSRILIRGEARRFGDVAPRRFLEILSSPEEERATYRNGSGRLQLAEEIVHPDNPLTSRVIVNRVWAKYFGEGLVPSISDFGLRSEKPVHFELLDFLAKTFVEEGWSLKKLHKMILMSATYQQSSVDNSEYAIKDPGNALLWKMNLQRLDFESLRDTVLYHGGSIDLTVGGRPFDVSNEEDQLPRRTLYAYIDRENLPEIFRTFDFANPDMTISRRDETTVPQQALFMMNSPLVIQQARAIMERSEIRELQSTDERLNALFKMLFQRDVTPLEVSKAKQFLSKVEEEDKVFHEVNAWSYGYSIYRDDKPTVNFKPFRQYEQHQYQFNRRFPDPRFGKAALHAEGGWAVKDIKYGVVRRWTSPVSGKISIEGDLDHQAEESDGVIGFIHVSGSGQIWKGQASNGHAKLSQTIEIKKGAHVDFLVLPGANDKGDSFSWTPEIRFEERVFSAVGQFGPPKKEGVEPLKPWEKLAQVLLESNEMIFLN